MTMGKKNHLQWALLALGAAGGVVLGCTLGLLGVAVLAGVGTILPSLIWGAHLGIVLAVFLLYL
jgi:hypothetical protein